MKKANVKKVEKMKQKALNKNQLKQVKGGGSLNGQQANVD